MKSITKIFFGTLFLSSSLFANEGLINPIPSTNPVDVTEPAPEIVIDKAIEEKIVIEEVQPVNVGEMIDPTIVENGRLLFASCTGCHGEMGNKKALNVSKVIAGFKIVDTTKALNGYKDGSYGGAMKGVMKAQVTRLDDKQIEALAQYISTLNP